MTKNENLLDVITRALEESEAHVHELKRLKTLLVKAVREERKNNG